MSDGSMIERVARAIAKANGDDFDALPSSKSEWNRKRGMFGGRFRDINEPMQADYEHMAYFTIEAMRKPTETMAIAGGRSTHYPARTWANMIDAALEEPTARSR